MVEKWETRYPFLKVTIKTEIKFHKYICAKYVRHRYVLNVDGFHHFTIYTTIGIHRCTFDVEIVSITTKPCVLQLFLFQWLCCKYLAWWHGHSHFWPQRSWRLLEAKNTAGRPKKAWKSWFIKKVFNTSFSTTSKTSYRIQSNLSYDLR